MGKRKPRPVKPTPTYRHPPTPAEQEVLDNADAYEVRLFRGRGQHKSEMFDSLEAAREEKAKHRGRVAIFAHGPIPSRGGERGVCIVA